MRARNRVIAGIYEGYFVGSASGSLVLRRLFRPEILLDNRTVRFYTLIHEVATVSMADAAVRGFVGAMMLGPSGVVAAATAQEKGVHWVGIEFRDGSRSVVEVDERVMAQLAVQPFWVASE